VRIQVKASSLASSRAGRTQRLCWLILLGGYVALYPLQRNIDWELGGFHELADALYLPSGETLRHVSLGYEGLLADIYWTRVVQYFGRKRLSHATRFELLGPLLRITTALDPHLLVAYRYGSIFLAEKPPWGAGQPEEALQLVRRGIVANPSYWRLWQDLGFIYYWDLKDYTSASRVFLVGSQRPGALVWMKVMAAAVAAQGGESRTSRLLWSEIYRQADNDQVRQSALEHLAALEAREQIKQLNDLLIRYEEREYRLAGSFQELVAAGYLRAVPKDPSGVPYVVGADGRAALAPQSRVDLRLLQ
jgi:hypothetical protein